MPSCPSTLLKSVTPYQINRKRSVTCILDLISLNNQDEEEEEEEAD